MVFESEQFLVRTESGIAVGQQAPRGRIERLPTRQIGLIKLCIVYRIHSLCYFVSLAVIMNFDLAENI